MVLQYSVMKREVKSNRVIPPVTLLVRTRSCGGPMTFYKYSANTKLLLVS